MLQMIRSNFRFPEDMREYRDMKATVRGMLGISEKEAEKDSDFAEIMKIVTIRKAKAKRDAILASHNLGEKDLHIMIGAQISGTRFENDQDRREFCDSMERIKAMLLDGEDGWRRFCDAFSMDKKEAAPCL